MKYVLMANIGGNPPTTINETFESEEAPFARAKPLYEQYGSSPDLFDCLRGMIAMPDKLFPR